MGQNTATVSSVTVNVADLIAKEKELVAIEKEMQAVQAMATMDAAKAAVNPAYIAGSLRQPTAEDKVAMGSRLHAVYVGEIRCQLCGETWLVNAGDLHQVRFCAGCRSDAKKAAGKGKRAQKRVVKLIASTGNLDEALAAKRAALEALKAKLAK